MDYNDCLGYQLGFCRLRCAKPEICDDFKSKSKFIVLPCGVGDTVWYITGIRHTLIKPAKIKEIIIDKDGIKDLYVQGDGCDFENSFDIFYTTKEEAQRALEKDGGEKIKNG